MATDSATAIISVDSVELERNLCHVVRLDSTKSGQSAQRPTYVVHTNEQLLSAQSTGPWHSYTRKKLSCRREIAHSFVSLIFR